MADATERSEGSGGFLAPGDLAIERFLDNLAVTLLSKDKPIDRVIWVKGTYPVPDGTPKRLSTLINELNSSSQIVRTPDGRPKRWLTIVTARMVGFSAAFLKEPVYRNQAGEVIEEPNQVTEPRRLIASRDAARRLAIELSSLRFSGLALDGGDAADDEGIAGAGLKGRLAFNGYEIFNERGYLFSRAAVRYLSARLAVLEKELAAGQEPSDAEAAAQPRGEEAVRSLAGALDPVLTISYEFPRSLAGWATRPAASLSPDDRQAAVEFVRTFNRAVSRAAEAGNGQAADGEATACQHVYVSARDLGIGEQW